MARLSKLSRSIAGSVAIITGAASGIGLELARREVGDAVGGNQEQEIGREHV